MCLSVPVKDAPSVTLSRNACSPLIDVDVTVAGIYKSVMSTLQAPPILVSGQLILVSRCPRGGETAILDTRHKYLQPRDVDAVTVSCNGVSGRPRVQHETHSESLRLVTRPPDSQIHKQAPRLTDWDMLDGLYWY